MIVKIVLAYTLALLSSASLAVEQLDYRVVDKKPQDRQNFVQGLEIHEGELYLSAGNYGESRLLKYNLHSGELLAKEQLHPRIFAEGLTVLNGRIYQLTWRERMMLVFDQDSFKPLQWFPIVGQGWGLTNDGQSLIYSDGSDQLHYLSLSTKSISHSLAVTENGQPVPKLNELEWIDGKIWANIWQTDRIVIIEPDTGKVTASIDLSGLLPETERLPNTDVLNGIALDRRNGAIWVTGKRWPWLYQIEIQQSDANSR